MLNSGLFSESGIFNKSSCCHIVSF